MRLFRRSGAGNHAAAPSRRRAAPPPGEVRRERRLLLRERENRLRDLGGLVMEMYRQDSFREHLLFERSAEVSQMGEGLLELVLVLDVRRPPAALCVCGEPIFWGSYSCENC